MSNFAFAKVALPTAHPDCLKVEPYLTTDPRAACFSSRRAIEHLVGYLYEVLNLSEPYRNDLVARMNDGAFKTRTGDGINQKLNLIPGAGSTCAPSPPSTWSPNETANVRVDLPDHAEHPQ
ncbi:hypothetical protein [Pseudactinotalea sp. Z1748]|uniref:hypothetical protein n=1 Tax=Pseudactinotalea sp. Z1748 TaxID=3413027 RepID=UPI003C7B287E